MSFWAKLGLKILDLECFMKACADHDVEYKKNEDVNYKWQGNPVEAVLTDKKAGSHSYGSNAYLVRADGAYKLMIDNDAHYSTITARVGSNGGKITRDYTKAVIEKGVRRNGGMVNFVNEQPDGSIIMKISSM
jgi:hypothetical protein